MMENGEDPEPTPARWKLTLCWSPSEPGYQGLHAVMMPVIRLLSTLDQAGALGFSVYVGSLDNPEPWLPEDPPGWLSDS
jgi:hypothetical protein